MTMYPSVQAKARAEIDSVCGLDSNSSSSATSSASAGRLPNFEDQSSLPYIEALIKELYRWGVTVPLGIPHRSTEEMEYNGWDIPSETVIIANLK